MENLISFYWSYTFMPEKMETGLKTSLQRHGITDIVVCGLAADVCVGNNQSITLPVDIRQYLYVS